MTRAGMRTFEDAIAEGRRLPRILVKDRPLWHQSDEALDALQKGNKPPVLFVRSGRLTRVRPDERGRPLIEMVREAELRGQLARVAHTITRGKVADVHVTPPDALVRDVLTRGDWEFDPLQAIVEAPVLRPDGSILDAPGYDAATALLYIPPPGFKLPAIPHAPTPEELAAAVALVREAVCDFPFDGDASRANAIGLLLTPILRAAIDGQVPLALIDSTKAGTGKGLLASAISIVATGRVPAMMSPPQREEEWRKLLLATLAAGPSIVVLDNVEATLRSPGFASALTSGHVVDRVLGVSETLDVPNRATWIATGNNIKVGGDLARRCYQIRLDAVSARPWTRSGFKRDPLLPWIHEHQAELVASALTIARAWFAAGCPEASVPVVGGFESWARVVGGVLGHARVEGFLGNVEALYVEADQDAGEWEAFLDEWQKVYGDEPALAGDVAEHLGGERSPLRDVLPGELADKLRSQGFTRSLGHALAKHEGARYGKRELYVERASTESRGGRTLWRVRAGSQVSQISLHRPAETNQPFVPENGTNKSAQPVNLQVHEGQA